MHTVLDEFDDISHTPYIRILQGMAVLIMLVSLPLPVVFWSDIPDHIPQHFGVTGLPDSWGGRANIVVFPIMNVFIVSLLFAYRPPEKNPHQYFHAQVSISLFRVWVASICTYIEWMAIRIALGKAHGLGVWFSLISWGIVIVIVVYAIVSAYVTDKSDE